MITADDGNSFATTKAYTTADAGNSFATKN